jgi:hypothetical protein
MGLYPAKETQWPFLIHGHTATTSQAVRRSVTWIQPMAIVYEVDHRGWTAAWRTQDEDGDWGEWHLEGPVPSRRVAWM